MARDPYYDDYNDFDDEGKGSKTLLLVGAVVLMLVLIVLCVMLTLKLRGANSEIEQLNSDLVAAQAQQQSGNMWDYSAGTDAQQPPVESDPIGEAGGEVQQPAVPEATPAPTPAPTPEPTPAPIPTPSPEPLVQENGLPSWLSEADMKYVKKRPADDEWYSAPGKLYVTAELGLNMRGGYSSDYSLITTIPKGTEVTVYAGHGDWRLVKDAKGNVGWCSVKLLSTEPPAGMATPTPSPTVAPIPSSDPNAPAAEAPSQSGTLNG